MIALFRVILLRALHGSSACPSAPEILVSRYR